MSKIWQQLVGIWSRLEIAQRATVVLVAVVFLGLMVFLVYGTSRPDYRALASGLSKGQLAEIAATLDQNHVAYRIVESEGAVMVPSKDLYRMRNTLAQADLLGDGSKGFEILGKGGMMESTFSEHRTYDRAVAGELERGFRELPGVRSARVLIDRPQPSPFVGDDSAKPKASVKLDMKPGTRLTDRQIAGILHLTAGAVAGLAIERVEIMDSSGLLTPNVADSGAMMAQTALDAEMAREAHLTRKAQEQLDAVLGPGRSQVKVSVKLDFGKRSEASSDPTKAVVLEETSQSSNESTPVMPSGGLAGTAPNVEGENRPVAAPAQTGTKSTEQANSRFVVGKKTVTIEDEVGRVRGMNVSILLDFKSISEPKDKANPEGERILRREAYGEGELGSFKELVLNAVGFNAAKDIAARVEAVANLDARFTSSIQSLDMYRAPEPIDAPAATVPFGLGAIADWAGYAVLAVVALGLLLVARGQLRRSHAAYIAAEERARSSSADATAKRDGAEGEDDERKALQTRRAELRGQIRKRIAEDPNAAAQVIRTWLYE